MREAHWSMLMVSRVCIWRVLDKERLPCCICSLALDCSIRRRLPEGPAKSLTSLGLPPHVCLASNTEAAARSSDERNSFRHAAQVRR
eukprot:5344055-Amphidinium_carterae.1